MKVRYHEFIEYFEPEQKTLTKIWDECPYLEECEAPLSFCKTCKRWRDGKNKRDS